MPVPPSCLQARKYIPDAFQLVSFAGWTLGGFYLARYTNSPVGAFDEVFGLGERVCSFFFPYLKYLFVVKLSCLETNIEQTSI